MITPSVRGKYITHVRVRESDSRRGHAAILALYPTALVCLSLLHMLHPQRMGLVALTEVFAPFLFLPLVILMPATFARDMAVLRWAMLAAALVYGGRFLPHIPLSGAQPAVSDKQLDVLSANLRVDSVPYGQLKMVLTARPADIVMLQESGWERLGTDESLASTYPYRLVHPRDTAPGLIVLSKYRIKDHGVLAMPGTGDVQRVMWARLDLGAAGSVTVINAHPLPPLPPDDERTACTGSFCYNTALRDAQIKQIHAFVSTRIEQGERVLLAGDFNVTEREPAYRDLTAGLQDAYKLAGSGSGNTWRPVSLIGYSVGLLRIDYMFTGPGIAPVSFSVDCTARGSDHCIQRGRFAIR